VFAHQSKAAEFIFWPRPYTGKQAVQCPVAIGDMIAYIPAAGATPAEVYRIGGHKFDQEAGTALFFKKCWHCDHAFGDCVCLTPVQWHPGRKEGADGNMHGAVSNRLSTDGKGLMETEEGAGCESCTIC
jgi:hypothetical protein